MTHRKLLGAMAALLFFAGGGVFVLLNYGGGKEEFRSEAYVAGVHLEEPSEASGSSGSELFETKLQKEEKTEQTQNVSSNPQASQPVFSPIPPKFSPPPAPTPAPTSKIEKVQVMSPEPTPPPPAPSPKPVGKIDINTAGIEELDQITGVGPAIAQRIIDYRNANGLFYHIEDIKNVSGIGEVTFEKMKDEITVGDVVASTPTPTSTLPPPPPPSPLAPEPGKININTAGYEELQEITGVGPVIAQRIIDYRVEHGPFQKIEDIKLVSGIGDATFEKMKDEIEV